MKQKNIRIYTFSFFLKNLYGEKNWKNLCTHLLMSFCKARVEGNVQLAYNKIPLTFLVNSKLLIRNLLESFSLLRKSVHLYTKTLIYQKKKSKKQFANPRVEILEKSRYAFRNTRLHTFNFCSYNIDIFWKFGGDFQETDPVTMPDLAFVNFDNFIVASESMSNL